MLTMRNFSKDDWYAFGGAERFEDGDDPLIGRIIIRKDGKFENEYLVVADGNQNFYIHNVDNTMFGKLTFSILYRDLSNEMTSEEFYEASKKIDWS